MLQLLALGAVIGAMWGALKQQSNSSAADGQPQADSEQQQQQRQRQRREQPSPRLPAPLRDNLAQHQDASSSSSTTSNSNSDSTPVGRMSHNAKIAVAAVGGLAALAAAAAVSVLIGRRRRHGRSKRALGRTDGRIPLKDLIRFKERQWFVEELELARDADPNSMIRLAKMYLNGQGCQRNIALAQEWVRKARSMGVPATLDELYATDDPDPHTKLRQLAAMEERRRAMRQHNSGAKAGHRHDPKAPQQHRHTAAA